MKDLNEKIHSNKTEFQLEQYYALKPNINFIYFCKTCLLSICDNCKRSHEEKRHKLIELKYIKIDNNKLNKLIDIINSSNFII